MGALTWKEIKNLINKRLPVKWFLNERRANNEKILMSYDYCVFSDGADSMRR